jgi:hypothetical protein
MVTVFTAAVMGKAPTAPANVVKIDDDVNVPPYAAENRSFSNVALLKRIGFRNSTSYVIQMSPNTTPAACWPLVAM